MNNLTAVDITAIGGAVVLIIGAITTAALKIIEALHATKEVVVKTAAVNVRQDAKLDQITFLVDGRYTSVLHELSDVKRLLAEVTGKPADIKAANKAQTDVDEHAAHVALAPPAPLPDVPFDKPILPIPPEPAGG